MVESLPIIAQTKEFWTFCCLFCSPSKEKNNASSAGRSPQRARTETPVAVKTEESRSYPLGNEDSPFKLNNLSCAFKRLGAVLWPEPRSVTPSEAGFASDDNSSEKFNLLLREACATTSLAQYQLLY
ncbi:unnamed protein product [Mucor hiemalis]